MSTHGHGPSAARLSRTAARVVVVPDLIAAIEAYLNAHNTNPKPFVWTATAEDILAKVERGRVALQQAAS